MTDITITPTAEQKQRVEWDLILRDLELRGEQIRQMKAFEGRRLVIQAVSAAAAVFIAGAAVGGLLIHSFSQTAPIVIQLDRQK
jgi:hypothetical protein